MTQWPMFICVCCHNDKPVRLKLRARQCNVDKTHTDTRDLFFLKRVACGQFQRRTDLQLLIHFSAHDHMNSTNVRREQSRQDTRYVESTGGLQSRYS
jgi:hypothetical protein